MSIIYDALKKTENKLDLTIGENKTAGTKRAGSKKPYTSYLLTIAVALILAGLTYNVITKSQLAKSIKVAPSEYAQAKLGLKLTLNGIFASEDATYALINNQIVREGDVFMGATIRRITSKAVELDKNGVVVRLSNYVE